MLLVKHVTIDKSL